MATVASAPFIVQAGCIYVLVGHSERRQYFGETDETAQKRVKAGLAVGLNVVLCVGETLSERDADETDSVVERQLRGGLHGVASEDLGKVVVAYEPVWAIGTGRVASPEQAQQVHRHIRTVLGSLFGASGQNLPVLYGGSVKADNAKGLLAQPDIDGALVGGASLDATAFSGIGSAFAHG